MLSSSLREKTSLSLSRATGQVSKTLISGGMSLSGNPPVKGGSRGGTTRQGGLFGYFLSHPTIRETNPPTPLDRGVTRIKNSTSSIVIRGAKAFTLVELMIVIAIIGVLAASLFPMISGYMAKSRDTARMAAVKQMNTAIFSYYQDTGRYPTAGGIGNATRNSSGSISSTGSEWKYDTTKPNNLGTQIAQMMPNMPTDPISTNAYVYGYVYDGGNNGGYYRLYADYERAASEKGLVGYWDMSTLTGSLLRDMSGNGNDGTCYNGTTSGACGSVGPMMSGGVMVFDGVNQWFEIPDPSLTIHNWSLFFSLNSSKVQESLFINPSSYGQDQFVYLTSANKIGLHLAAGADSGERNNLSTINSILQNKTYYIGLIRTTDAVEVYIDGVLNQSLADTSQSVSWLGKWSIGRRYTGTHGLSG